MVVDGVAAPDRETGRGQERGGNPCPLTHSHKICALHNVQGRDGVGFVVLVHSNKPMNTFPEWFIPMSWWLLMAAWIGLCGLDGDGGESTDFYWQQILGFEEQHDHETK